MTAPTSTEVDTVVALGCLALDFGRVDRITYHQDGVTLESDTDHTVMLGLVACALASSYGLGVGLVAEYALVHDLVEVYAGDTPTLHALGVDAKQAKAERERAAYVRIEAEFAGLPWLAGRIAEYEDLATPEARFVKALDKFMPKITHIANGGATLREQGMSRDELVARYDMQGEEIAGYASDFPGLLELRAAMVERVVASWPAASEAAS